ncbi:MAG: DUF2071 domain-containing protein [Acidobacteriota bacterium]
MNLRSLATDCLLLSWALPARRLPALREPLRYETRLVNGERRVQVMALLFHSGGLRVSNLPRLPLTHPQLNLCAAVRDPAGVPSLLFLRVLVPSWVLPAARLLAGHPTRSGAMDFPRPSRDPEVDRWSWEATREHRLALSAQRYASGTASSSGNGAARPVGEGMDYRAVVDALLRRRRTYFLVAGGYRCLETSVREVEPWPLAVNCESLALLEGWLPAGDENNTPFPQPELAVLLPELAMTSEYCIAPEALTASVPEPVTSRRTPLIEAPRSFAARSLVARSLAARSSVARWTGRSVAKSMASEGEDASRGVLPRPRRAS